MLAALPFDSMILNYYIATPEARLMQFQCLSILLAAILSEFDLMLFYSQMKTN